MRRVVAPPSETPRTHSFLGRQFTGETMMHVPAHELLGAVTFGDASYGGGLRDRSTVEKSLYTRKLNESIESGLAGDIADNGVKTPVQVVTGWAGSTLLDGHHRAISAAAADPDMKVPVYVQAGY